MRIMVPKPREDLTNVLQTPQDLSQLTAVSREPHLQRNYCGKSKHATPGRHLEAEQTQPIRSTTSNKFGSSQRNFFLDPTLNTSYTFLLDVADDGGKTQPDCSHCLGVTSPHLQNAALQVLLRSS